MAHPYSCLPDWAFPQLKTRPREMLACLLGEKVIAESELCHRFGHNYRSAIQILEGKRYCWRIENVLDEKGVIVGRKLDSRHLSGDPRLERAVELKQKSAEQAFREKRRASIARVELDIAMEQLAAFDVENENAPTEVEA